MGLTNKEKHLKIINGGLNGKSAESIGLELGLSKERVCQVLRKYNIDTRKIRREISDDKCNDLVTKATTLLNNGLSVQNVRKKLNISGELIIKLKNKGVDLRIIKKDEIKKRNQKCLTLYKKGLTAYEIIELVSEVNSPNQVYHNICKINGSRLPKRVNSRVKKGIKLDKEIFRLKKRLSFEEVTKSLNEKGFTNLNNGELKVGSVVNRYYKYRLNIN